MSAVRQTIPQVAIAPGGNKVVVHHGHRIQHPLSQAQRLPHSVSHGQLAVRPRMIASPRASTSSLRPQQPLISSTIIKQESSSPAPGHREKRKFESFK